MVHLDRAWDCLGFEGVKPSSIAELVPTLAEVDSKILERIGHERQSPPFFPRLRLCP